MDTFEEQLRKIEKVVYETKYPALEMEYENTFMNKVRKFFGFPQTVKMQEIIPNVSNNSRNTIQYGLRVKSNDKTHSMY